MRNYKRKTEKGTTSSVESCKESESGRYICQKAANDFQIPYSTLRRYCKKFSEEVYSENVMPLISVGYIQNRKVAQTCYKYDHFFKQVWFAQSHSRTAFRMKNGYNVENASFGHTANVLHQIHFTSAITVVMNDIFIMKN